MPVKRFEDLIDWKVKIDKEAMKQADDLKKNIK